MARRLNKPLLYAILGGVALIVAVLVAAVVVWRVKRPSIESLVAKGDTALQQGDYQAAVNAYGAAANRDRTNTDLAIKTLDVYEYTINGDGQKWGKYITDLKGILLVDPKNKPALGRLITQLQQLYVANPTNMNVNQQLETYAKKLYDIEPTNRQARLALVLCVLEPWAAGDSLDPNLLDQRTQMCVDLSREDPTDTQAALYLVRLREAEAAMALSREERSVADTKISESLKVADEILQKDPKNAGALYGKYDALSLRARSGLTEPTKRQAALDEAAKFLDAANDNAKPGDPLFTLVRTQKLYRLESIDVKAAEAGYRQLMQEDPNDRSPRVGLAELIARQPTRRAEAIALLKSPFTPRVPAKGLQSLNQEGYREEEAKRLCQLKLDQLDEVTDPGAREAQLKEVETAYQQMAASKANDPALLRIKAGIEVQRDHVYDAINTLSGAEKLTKAWDQANRRDKILRMEILQDFANAHLRLHQTGPAQEPLREILKYAPNYYPARFSLAKLLIEERRFDEASKQVQYLKEKLPDNPAVNVLLVQTIASNREDLPKIYPTMAEGTMEQAQLKLRTANMLNQTGEMVRLGKLLTEKWPATVENWLLSAQSLVRDGKRDAAIEELKRGQAATNDKKLAALINLMTTKTTPNDVIAEVMKAVTDIPEPFARELAQATVYARFNRPEEMVQHLQAAISMNPSDSRPQNMLFQYYLSTQQWDKAAGMLQTLQDINADQTKGRLRKVELLVAQAMVEPNITKRNGMLDDAIGQTQTIVAEYKTIADTTLLLGKLYALRGQADRAAEQYAATLDLAPSNMEAIRGMVAATDALGHYNDTKRFIDRGLELQPNDDTLKQAQVTWQITHGDPAKAIDELKAARDRFPESAPNWLMLGLAQLVDAQNMQRRTNPAAAAQFEEAIKTFAKALEKWPDNLEIATYLSESYRAAGKNPDANRVLEEFSKRDAARGHPEVVVALARSYMRGGDAKLGEQKLTDYLNTVSEAPLEVVLALCEIQLSQRRIDDALTTLARRPEDPLCQYRRAELLLGQNKVAEARALTDSLIAKGVSSVAVLDLRAFIELRVGDLTQARKFIDQALALNSQDAGALFYRAQASLLTVPPDLESATRDLSIVRDVMPGNIEARLALANVLTRQHNREGAELELEAAWAANRDSKIVAMELLRVYSASKRWNKVQTVLAQARERPQFVNDPDLKLAEANMLIAKGRDNYPKAIEVAKDMLGTSPGQQAIAAYIDILVRAGKPGDALAEVEKQLAKNPDTWWLLQLRALALKGLDRREDSLKAFDASIDAAIKSGGPMAVEAVGASMSSAWGSKTTISRLQARAGGNDRLRLLMARLMADNGDPDGAAVIANDLLNRKANLQESEQDAAMRIAAVAALQSVQPDPARSCELYEKIYQKSPDDWMVLNNYACALAARGTGDDLKLAHTLATRANNLINKEKPAGFEYVEDTLGWVTVLMAEQAKTRNQNDLSRKLLDDGLRLLKATAETAENDFPDVHVHLAKAYILQRDFTSADTELTAAGDLLKQGGRADPAMTARINELRTQIDAANGGAK